MSTITLLLALLGIASFAVLFYFLRFKASSRQTDRDNRIPWHKYGFSENDIKKLKLPLKNKKNLKLKNNLLRKMMLILKINC